MEGGETMFSGLGDWGRSVCICCRGTFLALCWMGSFQVRFHISCVEEGGYARIEVTGEEEDVEVNLDVQWVLTRLLIRYCVFCILLECSIP